MKDYTAKPARPRKYRSTDTLSFCDIGKKFPQRLFMARKDHDLTMEELARLVGAGKATIWNLENKPFKRVSASMLYRLAVALGVTMEYLLDVDVDNTKDRVFIREYVSSSPLEKRIIQALLGAVKAAGVGHE